MPDDNRTGLTPEVIGPARNYFVYWENKIALEINIVRVTGRVDVTIVIDVRQFLKIVCRAQYQPPNEA